MLDFTKALPNTVTVDGKAYLLNTDFRVWIQFERDMKQNAITGKPFRVDYVFAETPPNANVTLELLEWARPKEELPRPVGNTTDAIAFDLDIDADLIYSAFLQQYGIDLCDTKMHWYKFLALIKGVSEQTQFAQVMSYRCYKKSDSKTDIREKLRRAWEIKPPITLEEQAEIDEFNSYFSEE